MKELTNPAAEITVAYVAFDQGFFKKNGIDLQLGERTSGGLGGPALISGDTDIVDITVPDVVNLRNQGKNAIAVYELENRVTRDLVVSNAVVAARGIRADQPLADRLRALKGLRFGITSPGGSTDVMTRYLLKQAGYDPEKDATIIQLGSFAGLAAGLTTNQIDAFFGEPPGPQQMVDKGVGKMVISSSAGEVPSLADFYYVIMVVRSDYATKNPDAVRRYIKSIREATDWMQTHRAETLASLGKRLPNVDPATIAVSYDSVSRSFSKDGVFTEDTMKSTLDAYKQSGAIDSIPPTQDGSIWTNKFNN